MTHERRENRTRSDGRDRNMINEHRERERDRSSAAQRLTHCGGDSISC